MFGPIYSPSPGGPGSKHKKPIKEESTRMTCVALAGESCGEE